ncbi:MAG: hypothetical protein JNG88_12145, partial [Phycisphaerales bacterium]|nr:hypothetical protein [Phycisphaerales bacterium]
GRTELHVFEGEVLCSEPKKQTVGQRNEVIHVRANNAMEFGAASGQPVNIAAAKAIRAGRMRFATRDMNMFSPVSPGGDPSASPLIRL